MIKTFVIPPLSPIIFYLTGYIAGIIVAHFIFDYTHSLVILGGVIGIVALSAIILFFIDKKSTYCVLSILCAMIKTGYILNSYETYTPAPLAPITIIEITKTGNPNWPFCTKLEQNNYGFLLFTKQKPKCSQGDVCATSFTFKKPLYNDFCRYLFKEQCVATHFLYSFSPEIISSSHSLNSMVSKKRESLLYSIVKKCSKKTAALFSSLCLGNKKIFNKDLRSLKLYFKSWGIVHHLARSGLHLIIILFVWYLLLSLAPIPYTSKIIIISLIATLFAVFSFEGISFTRSLVIFFLVQFLLFSKQQTNTLHLLLCVAFVFLVINPFLLFSLDFQLSFYITLLLCLFSLINRQKRVLCCKLLLNDYKNA